jgi:hypothetical protein
VDTPEDLARVRAVLIRWNVVIVYRANNCVW